MSATGDLHLHVVGAPSPAVRLAGDVCRNARCAGRAIRLGFCSDCLVAYDGRRASQQARRAWMARAFLGQLPQLPLRPELLWELALLAAACAEAEGLTVDDGEVRLDLEPRWVGCALVALLAELGATSSRASGIGV